MLSAVGLQSRGSNDLEAKMEARMQAYRDAQLPNAEREADAIASTVNPSASVEEVKSTLGQRLGADFSGVNIHTGAGARDMADSIGADAYTQGKDVYLGEGASNAQTVAHELVHTVQQGGVSGFGVSRSADFGTVQMKPGKRARLKNWFKRVFHLSSTKENDNGEMVTDNGAEKIIEPEALMGTDIFSNMNKTERLNKLQNYNHTDKTAKVRQMEAGEYDDHFDNLETDEERVEELQKLAQYLSAVREDSNANNREMSPEDLKLEQTYKSSLQKASGSDSFMKTLMDQSRLASEAMRGKNAEVEKDFQQGIIGGKPFERKFAYNKEMMNGTSDAAKEYQAGYRAEERAELRALKNARYASVVDSEEGRRFNALRFMMGDAAGLMVDGERRAKWNELRRQRFEHKQTGDGDIWEDAGKETETLKKITDTAETKGKKGVHEGQKKVYNAQTGEYDYTDISRYVSEMHAGFSTFSQANSALAADDSINAHKANNTNYIQKYKEYLRSKQKK